MNSGDIKELYSKASKGDVAAFEKLWDFYVGGIGGFQGLCVSGPELTRRVARKKLFFPGLLSKFTANETASKEWIAAIELGADCGVNIAPGKRQSNMGSPLSRIAFRLYQEIEEIRQKKNRSAGEYQKWKARQLHPRAWQLHAANLPELSRETVKLWWPVVKDAFKKSLGEKFDENADLKKLLTGTDDRATRRKYILNGLEKALKSLARKN